MSIEDALVALGRPFNDYDFSQHDLDAPFPTWAPWATTATRAPRTSSSNWPVMKA